MGLPVKYSIVRSPSDIEKMLDFFFEVFLPGKLFMFQGK